jgi:hypothetical protein
MEFNRVGLFQWDAAKPMANPTYLETRNLPTDVTPKLAVVCSFRRRNLKIDILLAQNVYFFVVFPRLIVIAVDPTEREVLKSSVHQIQMETPAKKASESARTANSKYSKTQR